MRQMTRDILWDRRLPLLVLMAANGLHGMQLADQHMARRLARYFRILYVDPPMSHPMALRTRDPRAALARPRLRAHSDNLAHLTTIAPPYPERLGIRNATRIAIRAQVRRATEIVGPADILVSARPIIPDLEVCPARKTVFWAQDDFVGGARLLGLSAEALRRGCDYLADQADLLISSTPGVSAYWESRGYKPKLVAYGCDAAAYRDVDLLPIPEDVILEPPVVGFVGQLGERIDTRLFTALADEGIRILLVGPIHTSLRRTDLQGLIDRSNVQWVGPKEFSDLPSYMRAISVGVVPYTDSAFNRGSFPLKTLEYLAAGRPVVATDLPAIRWLDTEFVSIASTPDDFVSAVDDYLRNSVDSCVVLARKEFAACHSWPERARQFAEILRSV